MIDRHTAVVSCRSRATSSGFTLLEMLLGLTLLVAMMAMVYGALRLGVRAWDAGDQRVTEAAHWRSVEHFLRRELGQVFPVRWRGVALSQIAFEGTKTDLKYVTGLNLDAGLKTGGLAWSQLRLVDGRETGGVRTYALELNRQSFDIQAKDWSGLTEPSRDAINLIPPTRLIDGIISMELAYFGAENDIAVADWAETWNFPNRLPQLVRVRFETVRGRSVPDLVFGLRVGEEAGCLEQSFIRQCGPRRR